MALIVCGFLGLDTSGNSIPYLAVWSEHTPADAFEQTAALVHRLARRIESSLDSDPDDNPAAGAAVTTVSAAA